MSGKIEEEHSADMKYLGLTSRNSKFWFLVIGIIFFFGCHNYMQELIMSLPGFKVCMRVHGRKFIVMCNVHRFLLIDIKIGIVLGYLEVLGVVIGSGIERHVAGETTRKESWLSYGVLCLCLLVSSATSNIALAYINYPTKVVFRSCKLIPTMLIAVFLNRKQVPWYEFMFGGFISLGMVFFAAADFTVYPNFDFIGT